MYQGLFSGTKGNWHGAATIPIPMQLGSPEQGGLALTAYWEQSLTHAITQTMPGNC